MDDFEITGMTRIDKRRSDRFGAVAVAFFTVNVRGLKISGCTLKRFANGDIGVAGPAMPDSGDNKRSIKIIDKDLRDNLANAAVLMFKAVGGDDDTLLGKPLKELDALYRDDDGQPHVRYDDTERQFMPADNGVDIGGPRVRFFDT